MIPWEEAWQEALYGKTGFYRQSAGPAGHFATSTHPPLGPVFAEAIAALADREGVCRVVDIGCGRGELLRSLHSIRPDLDLVGIDVVERPQGLPEGVGWLRSPGGPALPSQLRELEDVLVLAHEWLDVVPCPILEADDAGVWRTVLVDPSTGVESLSHDAVPEADIAWHEEHWLLPAGDDVAPGSRIEVGRPRDEAWSDLCGRVTSGVVVAIDYGHLAGARPHEGTLTAYAHGQPVSAVPDGSCDLTAHVAMDSLGEAEVRTQREWIRELGLRVEHPPHELASRDPFAYLKGLNRMGVISQLTQESGLGGFLWAVRRMPGPA